MEACDYIPTLEELSQYVELSSFHLQREFKKVLGISPRNYASTGDYSEYITTMYCRIRFNGPTDIGNNRNSWIRCG